MANNIFSLFTEAEDLTPIGVITASTPGVKWWEDVNCHLCISNRGNKRRFHFVQGIRTLKKSSIPIADCAFDAIIPFYRIFSLSSFYLHKYETV